VVNVNLLDIEDFFDYVCPEYKGYVLLEKNEKNKNILDGVCAKCGLDISMLYEDWESWDKKKFIGEDEEMR